MAQTTPETDEDCIDMATAVMRRLATQDEMIAVLKADVAMLHNLARERHEALLAFADALASASGWVRREAEGLADRLG